jgi:hypothetical protein
MKKTFLLLFFALAATAFSETHLAGEYKNRIFTAKESPYIVDSTIKIPEGGRAVFQAGTVLLFNQFCGIEVYGDIVVDGTKDKPVVFTSFNDAEYNDQAVKLANSFDWNGIIIEGKENEANFNNFKLLYSIFGLKSKNRQVVIHNGLFSQNGQYNFTIYDKIIDIKENQEVFFNSSPEAPKKDTVFIAPKINEAAVSSANKKRTVLKVTGALLFGAGLVGGIVGGYSAYNANKQYENYDKTPYTEFKKRNDYYSQYETSRKTAAITIPIASVFVIAGAVIFYVDDIRKLMGDKKSKAVIKVSSGLYRDGIIGRISFQF